MYKNSNVSIESYIPERYGFSFYEKACNFASKLITFKLDELTEKKMTETINFSGLRISPSGPISLLFLMFIAVTPIMALLAIVGLISGSTIFAFYIIFIFFAVWIYFNPMLTAMSIRSKASSEMVLSILYMAIQLRETPNLESAVAVAASNMDGPIGRDLKKLLWELQMGKIISVENGLNKMMYKWYKEGKEFVEAIKLLINSVHQPSAMGEKNIDEAVDVVLSGSSERMERYSRGLKMPVMLIFTLGILLPVISLVLFPLVIIFLPEVVNVTFLVILYDMILPAMLFWVIMSLLQTRPVTTSSIDTGKSLKYSIPLQGKEVPILYILIPIFILLVVIFGIPLYEYHSKFSMCSEWQKCQFGVCKPENLQLTQDGCKDLMLDIMSPAIYSAMLLIGFFFSTGIVLYLSIYKYLTTRERVKKLEGELGEALFQLGYQMKTVPLEFALSGAIKNLENLEIAEFYKEIIKNIKNLGVGFEAAIFDKDFGAIKRYPSKLIKSIMKIIVEATKRGMMAASNSMLTISNYMKNTYKVQEKIDEIMSETVSTMKFMGMILSPLIAGITVALAIIVLNILLLLSLKLPVISGEGTEITTTGGFFFGLWGNSMNVGVDIFQLVIGIYIMESSIIMAIFINGIENGYDRITEFNLMGKMLIVSSIIFTVSSFSVYLFMGGLIKSLLLSGFG